MSRWGEIPSGNYLVRGDFGAVLRECQAAGETYWVHNPQALTYPQLSLVHPRTYYLYMLTGEDEKQLPGTPTPKGAYRMVVGGEDTDYKHPPPGYQYLDARALGRWEPAREFLARCPIPLLEREEEQSTSERLLQAVLRYDASAWWLPTPTCHRLFGQEEESGFFKYLRKRAGRRHSYRYTGAAEVHWRALAPHLELRYRVLLYGAWLVLLQRRQKALVYENRCYFFEPKPEPGLYHILGFPKIPRAIIENEGSYALEKVPEFRALENQTYKI